MSILKVCRLGHPVLRMEAQRVTPAALAAPALQTLIDDMMQTMEEYCGVGLAAPQVHESLAIAVIEGHGPRGEIPMTVLVIRTSRFWTKSSSRIGKAASAFRICAAAFRAGENFAWMRWTATAKRFKSRPTVSLLASFNTSSIT